MADISKIKLPNNSEYDIKDAKAFSRGEQLITNGSAILGDNTNFTAWTFDGSMANGSAGSFTLPSGTYSIPNTNDFFPVNPSLQYRLDIDFISKLGVGKMYTFPYLYDADKKEITAWNHMYRPNTLTTLTSELKAGDTVVHLADLTNWDVNTATRTYQRGFIFWNYTNSFGYTYPENTYSRNVATNLYTDANVNKTDNTITLTKAWAGATFQAGTKVSQADSGGNYKYIATSSATIPTTWKSYTGLIGGIDYSGKNIGDMFPPGVAYAKLGFLWNYQGSGNGEQIWTTNVSFKEVPVSLGSVDYGGVDTGLGSSSPASNAKEYFLDPSKVPTQRIKMFQNSSGQEYTLLFSNRTNTYGTILKWGYQTKYLYILRRYGSSWKSDDWEKIDAGNADTATLANALLAEAVTGETVDNFKGTSFRAGKISSYTNVGLASNDGCIIWIPYNASYGRQFLFEDTGYMIKSRYYNNGTWGEWRELAFKDQSSANALLNALSEGSSEPVDADYYIAQYAGGGTSTTTYHRRPVSALWGYIKGKISSVLGLTATTYGGSATSISLNPSTRPTTANNNYHDGKMRYYLATSSMTTGKPPADAQIIHLPWDNSGWDRQIAVVSGTVANGPSLYIRQEDGSGNWGDWTKVLDKNDLSTATDSTSTTTAATSSAVKTAYDLANSANTTANTALSGVNGNLIYDHTFTISNGVATFTPHVYQKGEEVTTNYAKSCFTWKYRLIDGSEVTLTTKNDRGCDVTITNLGYGGHVIGIFTPA